MNSRSRPGRNVPPRKPLNEHKMPMSVSIEREHREWLRENYKGLGYRSESHAIDDAIRLLIERAKGRLHEP